MITVRKVPPQFDAILLKAEKYTVDMYFNPQTDADGNDFISEEEFQQMDQEIKDKYPFLIDLVQIPYNPIIMPDPLGIPIGPPA